MPARSVFVSALTVALMFLSTSRSKAASSPTSGAKAEEAVLCSDRLDEMQRIHELRILESRRDHEKALLAMQGRLDDRTAELEALRRSCTSSPVAPNEASALTPLLETKDTNMTSQGTEETSQMPQGAQHRMLLASETHARPCSKAEMRTVLETPPSSPESRISAVTQILATNAECGLCILEFTSSPVPDIILDLQSCVHQDENMCDELGLSKIASLIPLASLHDRDSLGRIVELVEAGAFLHPIRH